MGMIMMGRSDVDKRSIWRAGIHGSVCLLLLIMGGSQVQAAAEALVQGPFYHVSFAVTDIEAAKTELANILGVTWRPTGARQFGEYSILTSMSLQGPPFIELIQGGKGGPWDVSQGSHMHHIGYSSEDVPGACEHFLASGLVVHFDPRSVGRPPLFCYFKSPATGTILEIVINTTLANLKAAAKEIKGADAKIVTQVGMVVPNMHVAMSQLSRALGVTWQTPFKEQYGSSAIKVAYSVQGPPNIKLIQGDRGGPWDVEHGAMFHHFTYESDNVPQECKRLADLGLSSFFDSKSVGKPETFCAYRLPAVGAVVEVSAIGEFHAK
jgi:hypothetical protein